MSKNKFGDSKNLEFVEDKNEDNEFIDDKKEEKVKVPPKKAEVTKEIIVEKVIPPQCVPLKTYSRVAGRKADQMAGFVYYAQKNKLGPMSIKEWHKEFDNFSAKPIK